MLPYIVGLGIAFDLITVRAIFVSITEKKFRPGVPLVSLICYGIFFGWEFIVSLDTAEFFNPYLFLAGGLIVLHILLQAISSLTKKKYS